ncbi:hypothetical protein QTP88_025112 [Uroleucon formosanum]
MRFQYCPFIPTNVQGESDIMPDNQLLPLSNNNSRSGSCAFLLVGSSQKQMIINLYKTKITQNAELKIKELAQIISTETGIGQNSVQKTILDYKNTGVVKSPNRKKIRLTIKEKIDDFEKNAVRRKVHNFWFKGEVPTLDKILKSVNEEEDISTTFSRTNLYRVLKSLNFVYSKRGRNSALIERNDIVIWRSKYLETIRKYRDEGRTIYYTDETWVNAGECTSKTWVDQTVKHSRDAFLKGLTAGAKNPTGKGKRLIVVHIGSERGFVHKGLLSFESKKNSLDYHDEMNGDTYFDWLKNVLPLLDDNCIIVMDNASYHSVKSEKFPTLAWKKCDIEKWLEEKGETFVRPINKPRLMELVNKIKLQYNSYMIDEYVKLQGKEVLRLPPYHCELNPIELALAFVKKHVKMNNSTFKLADVHKLLHEGVEKCTPEMWKNFVHHTQKEEARFWEIDFVVYDVLERMGSLVMSCGDTSNSESEEYSD